MKIGIVGAGNIVVDFLSAADKIDEIVIEAICATSRSEEKLKKFCEDYKIEKYFCDYKLMLDEESIETIDHNDFNANKMALVELSDLDK